MGIKGLTDRQASFPRIGELRKGAVKGNNRPGVDLTHFRFTSNIDGVESKFAAIYGNEPQAVNIFLPYASTDENFEAWQEEWAGGGLVHRCDGQYVVMYQKDGEYIQPQPGEMVCPYESGKRPRTKQKPGCKPSGRLKVILPELGRLAYVTALTTSINDIMELHANLSAYEALRGSLQGIPFILSRVPRMVSTPGQDGKRTRREKWLLHIEAAPDWVQAQLSVMQRQALPMSTTTPMLIESGDYDVDYETGEIVEDDPAADDSGWDDLPSASGGSSLAPDEKNIYQSAALFMTTAIDNIPRYDNAESIKKAMKKLGYSSVSGDKAGRLSQYRNLKLYAHLRANGRSDDEAVDMVINAPPVQSTLIDAPLNGAF